MSSTYSFLKPNMILNAKDSLEYFLLKVVQHFTRINWYRVVFGKYWMTPSPMESIRHLKV